jgi:hypothetical protein
MNPSNKRDPRPGLRRFAVGGLAPTLAQLSFSLQPIFEVPSVIAPASLKNLVRAAGNFFLSGGIGTRHSEHGALAAASLSWCSFCCHESAPGLVIALRDRSNRQPRW